MAGQSATESREQIVSRIRKAEMTNKNIKSPMRASKPEITHGSLARKSQPS